MIVLTSILLFVVYLETLILQSDAFWNNATTIIIALTALFTALIGGLIKFITFLRSIRDEVVAVKIDTKATAEKLEVVKKSIDGLLDQKTLADKALGRIEGIDTAAKEKGIADARELQVLREQQLLNQTPPGSGTKSDVKDVKDEIITTIKDRGDEIQEVVQEIPDEVIKKLPPQ